MRKSLPADARMRRIGMDGHRQCVAGKPPQWRVEIPRWRQSSSSMTRRTGTAIVVGASSGIGAALARRLALEGRKVAMLARREPELRAVAATIDKALGRQAAFPYVHDAAQHGEVPALLQRIEQDLGPADELHYVAGVMPEVAADEFDFQKDRL